MATSRPPLGASRWLIRRLVPTLIIVLTAAAAVGLTRRYLLFVPGIMGMIAGAACGWASGRLGHNDSAATWSFALRGWLALGAGMLYGVATAVVVSLLAAGSMGLPMDWLREVITGHEGELFAGSSKNSLQGVSGRISGAWWLIFNSVDALLFSFLFLVTTAAGWASTKPAAAATADEIPADGDSSPPPLTPDHTAPPLPLISFGVCVAFSVALLVGLRQWPVLVTSPAASTSSSEVIAELQGDWVFDEQASFLGPSESDRSFTLSFGLGDELAGFSNNPATFMLSLVGRRDGVFEGRLLFRDRDNLNVRMRPSDDRTTLDFVVDWHGPGGRSEKQVSAHRVGVDH